MVIFVENLIGRHWHLSFIDTWPAVSQRACVKLAHCMYQSLSGVVSAQPLAATCIQLLVAGIVEFGLQ